MPRPFCQCRTEPAAVSFLIMSVSHLIEEREPAFETVIKVCSGLRMDSAHAINAAPSQPHCCRCFDCDMCLQGDRAE